VPDADADAGLFQVRPVAQLVVVVRRSMPGPGFRETGGSVTGVARVPGSVWLFN
jgi:hypothetical protein